MLFPRARASLIPFLLGIMPTLFSLSAGATNPPGSYGGASIAGGGYYTVAAKNDGTLWAWGSNTDGQLGDGTFIDHATPIQISSLRSTTVLTAGRLHSAAIADGGMWIWGANDSGQLGDGTVIDRPVPIQVGILGRAIAIAAGGLHTVMLRSDGTVWAWGDNRFGQLGDGTLQNRRITPVQVGDRPIGAVAIAAGNGHTASLNGDGTVLAWGDNSFGQLGDGSNISHATPGLVVGVGGFSGVVALAAGYEHTIALKSDGTVWAWGGNGAGQLGDDSVTNRVIPVKVTGVNGVVSIAAGYQHSIALKGNGTVWAWGGNGAGQLGDGTTITHIVPVPVSGLDNVVAIAAGYEHSVALKSDGTVWAWGGNGAGQLGDGTTTNRTTPVQVLGPGGSGALNLFNLQPTTSSAHATNINISQSSPGRYRLLGTLVDANNQPACGLALASGRCVFSCGPGSLRCEGGTDSLALGQFELTDLPTETDGTLTLQTFVFGSLPGRQMVRSDGTTQLVGAAASSANSQAINPSVGEVSSGRYRLTGTLVDANGQPACGLALASGRCAFTCGPGSLRCEGGTSSLPLGQFELTDLPAEADGTLMLQTFVFGSLPGRQGQATDGGGCSYAITPTSQAFEYLGGTRAVTVSTQDGCAWTAQSHDGWITVTAGASGTGPGAVTYSVAANSSSAKRTGTLTIAGKTHTVTQSGGGDGGCSSAITPTSRTFEHLGGSGTVTVSTPDGCAWTATSHNNDWITVTVGASGTGSGTTTYTVAANASGAKRAGALTIAGQTHTVTQNPKGQDHGD